MNEPKYSFNSGIEIVDEALQSITNNLVRTNEPFGLSLTGGWDGRLILSYFLNKNDKFYLYSFGTENSLDIKIPKLISSALNLKYIPIYLDEDFIKHYFYSYGLKTIYYSNGFRNFNVGHYLYAMEKLTNMSNFIITGNCGSNLLKSVSSTGHIYNEYIKLIFDTYDGEKLYARIKHKFLQENPGYLIAEDVWNQFFENLLVISEYHRKEYTQNQNFYAFLLSTIENMYFGSEVSASSHRITNISPFTQLNFLEKIAQTPYFGAHHNYFSKKDKKIRFARSKLYAVLIKRNSPVLSRFITDRGYKIQDLLSNSGMLKILSKRFHNKIIKKTHGHGLIYDHNKFKHDINNYLSSSMNHFNNISINKPIEELNLNNKVDQNYFSLLVWKNLLDGNIWFNEK